MRLKKLVLKNYKQHRDLSTEIFGNLIAVVGRNGSGKSNFLGAIQFALTGEQPGFNKEDLLSWGESDGSVKLEFTYNGKDCVVERSISSTGCSLRIGEEKFSGVKKVSEALESIGIDKDLLKQSVFVRQSQIESCLFDDARTREQNFQRLLGLGDAAKVNKMLGDIITGVGQPENMDESVAEANEAISNAEARCAASRTTVESLRGQLDSKPKSSEIRERVQSMEAEASALKKSASDYEAWRKAMERWSEASARTEDLAMQDPVADESFKTLFGLNHDLDLTRRLTKAAKDLNAARKRFSECEKPEQDENLVGLLQRASELRVESDRLLGEREALSKMLRAVPDGTTNVCPLCGAVGDHDIVAELEGKIAAIDERRKEILKETSEVGSKVEACNREFQEKAVAYESAQRGVAEADTVMKSLFSQLKGRDPNEFKESLILGKIAEAKTRQAEIEEINSTIKAAKDEYLREKASYDAQRSVAERSGVLDVEIDPAENRAKADRLLESAERIRAGIPEVERLEADVIRAESSLHYAEEQLVSLRESAKKLAERKQRNDELRRKLKVLSDVRDWFHYSNGPRVLTQNVMRLLTDQINGYLDKFGSPFTVEPSSEGMGFVVRFSDGRAEPPKPPDALTLSGGQKIQLAVAFRFAVYTLFSSKLGLLSLDEPTVYLDAETIGRFGDLLQKIANIAKNQNLQVIMATHESSLAGVFDQTIHIGE